MVGERFFSQIDLAAQFGRSPRAWRERIKALEFGHFIKDGGFFLVPVAAVERWKAARCRALADVEGVQVVKPVRRGKVAAALEKEPRVMGEVGEKKEANGSAAAVGFGGRGEVATGRAWAARVDFESSGETYANR
jgi:hypothetical protein